MSAILQTNQLTKKYGEFVALNNVSLSLTEGDIYGLVGRNGAGKTTFFKCVMGLAKPTSGSVALAGETSNLNKTRQRMGFMINTAFFSYLNPRENLEYLCRVKKVRARRGEVDRLLKLVELNGVTKPFKKFSMGMKQRLGIAGALLGSPSLVVLDEPVNGLDPQGIADIRTVIKDARQQSGATFIVSSHILSELDLVATHFGFLEQGVLLKQISHANLHQQTASSLSLRVSDAAVAQTLLQSQLGVASSVLNANALLLEEYLDRPQDIARVLVQNDIELFELHRKETTLEEYFIRLIGGESND